MIEQTRITLKRLRVADFASQETLCFTAIVVFDGIAIADAENEGRGGCTFLRPRKGAFAKFAEAETFAKTLPPVVIECRDSTDQISTLAIEVTLSHVVEDLADAMHYEKKLRAAFRRDVVRKLIYVVGDRLLYQKGLDLRSVSNKEALYAEVRKCHGADTVILNVLSEDEAFAILKQFVLREEATAQERMLS